MKFVKLFTYCIVIVIYTDVFLRGRVIFHGGKFSVGREFPGVNFPGKFYTGWICHNSYAEVFCLVFSLATQFYTWISSGDIFSGIRTSWVIFLRVGEYFLWENFFHVGIFHGRNFPLGGRGSEKRISTVGGFLVWFKWQSQIK